MWSNNNQIIAKDYKEIYETLISGKVTDEIIENIKLN